jgi:hypothetical protein
MEPLPRGLLGQGRQRGQFPGASARGHSQSETSAAASALRVHAREVASPTKTGPSLIETERVQK